MPFRIKFKKQLLLSAGLMMTVIFSFQNCGQDMNAAQKASTSSSSNGVSTSLTPCIASGCPQSFNYIQIEISNNNPISFLASGANILETNLDVSGYCNMGGYPGSHIYYSIQDLAGNIVVPVSMTSGICSSLGKFHFPVGIGGLSGSSNYQLNVVLRGVDSTGLEFDNSLGLNKKQVGLSPRTGI